MAKKYYERTEGAFDTYTAPALRTVATDGSTITGDGTAASPLVAEGGIGATPLSGGSYSVSGGATAYFTLDADSATGEGASSDPTDLSNGAVEDAWVCPIPGTFSDLVTYANSAAGVGESYTVTVVKNAVASGIEVVYDADDTAKNDTANTLAVAAGDRVAIKIVASGGAAGSEFAWGILFTPAVESSALTYVPYEVPSGTINGTNDEFTFDNAPVDVTYLHLFLNGVRQTPTDDYTLAGAVATFITPPLEGAEVFGSYHY